MAIPKERVKGNIYGIRGMHNVYSWQGLAIHFRNSSRVIRCESYASCTSDKRSSFCNNSIRRSDALYMLQSEFNVTLNLAEKLIDTLVDMSMAKALRCYRAGNAVTFDDGTRMVVFDEAF